MPVQPDGRPYPINTTPATIVTAPAPAIIIPAPAPSVLNVRLYPANQSATTLGPVQGQVYNFVEGRGQFQVAIGAESFVGEATRLPNSPQGTASASGNRGSFLNCTYSMNSTALGSGTCSLGNGAQFRMHIGG
jgi:hypothetical protein